MKLAHVFKALSDETRQQIVEMLRERDLSASEIGAAFRLTQPSVSHHLSVLREAELVDCQRRGQRIVYSLNRTGFQECWSRFFRRFVNPD